MHSVGIFNIEDIDSIKFRLPTLKVLAKQDCDMKIKNIFTKISLIEGITLFFIFTMGVTLISSISSIYYTQNLYNGLKSMYENDLLGANYIQISRIALINVENYQKTLLISETTKDIEKSVERIKYFEHELLGNIFQADPLFNTPNGKIYINEAEVSAKTYISIVDRIIALHKSRQKNSAVSVSMNDANTAYSKLDALLNRMDDYKQEKNIKFYSTSVTVYKINLVVIFILFVGSVIIRIIFYKNQKKKKCV
jgi:hypothetical protein